MSCHGSYHHPPQPTHLIVNASRHPIYASRTPPSRHTHQNVAAYEHHLTKKLWSTLSAIEGLELYGPPPEADGSGRGALVAFNAAAVHGSDLAFFLDQEGLALRAGHHCTQPLHRLLGVPGSLRASCYLYNTEEEIDVLGEKIRATLEMFSSM